MELLQEFLHALLSKQTGVLDHTQQNLQPQSDRPKGHHAVDVRLLTLGERLDLAEALGEPAANERPSLPPLEEIPPLEIPRRREPGFVQVEFSVDARGRVTDAEVVRSMPEGLFDQQALEIIRSRQYPAGDSGRRTEVVDFTVEPGEK